MIKNRKIRMMNSRKGFFTDPLIDMFAFIAVVFLFVVFSIIFSMIETSGTYDIEGLEFDLDAETELIQQLRAPLEIDGYGSDVAGHIIYATGDKDKIERLEQELKGFFADVVRNTDADCIFFEIKDYVPSSSGHPQDLKLVSSSRQADSCSYGGKEAVALLPGKARTYEIRLVLRSGD